MMNRRFSLLIEKMQKDGLDAIALNPGSTLTWLTGLHFHLMERPTLFLYQANREPVLILPELEAGKVDSATIPITKVTFVDDPATWQQTIDRAVKDLGLDGQKIGVEPGRLRFLELEFLKNAAPSARFISGERALGDLKIQKEAAEIQKMHKAVLIAQQALEATLPFIKAGVTERQTAAELVIQLLRAGSSSELPFEPIVATGENSANPHAVPTDRSLQNGDLLVIDWGARFEDYCSDLTRTFAIGKLSEEQKRIFEVVKAANEAGRKAGGPEVETGKVDLAARKVIESAGFGQFFTHRTGHGLGMDAHETPYIFAANQVLLLEGMVYTVEPGIYIPGLGGVRIEDDVVVTKSGTDSLSDFSRDLITL